jgi:hypothetical protein
MSCGAEDADLTFNSLDIFSPHFGFIDYLNGYFLAGGDVHGQVHFSEGTLTEVFAFVFEKIPKR